MSQWQSIDTESGIGPRLLPLLEEIHQSGSLQAAAKEIKVSYRTAWELIRYWNEAFHTPLCIKERGRGSKPQSCSAKADRNKTKHRY